MSQQLHKRRTTQQVADVISKYKKQEITGTEAARYLGVGRTRFYQLVTVYDEEGDNFSVEYSREKPTRRLEPAIEKNIRKELEFEKKHLIDDPKVPVRRYNYSYLKEQLKEKYDQKVSVTTIIDRAKRWGFYQGKPPARTHDREVITNYTGELIQHDASHHLFAPLLGSKLVLITSLDDFSRALLYADFWTHETTWNHIQAAQSLILEHGVPLKYYTDQHRIFRYVKNRDSSWVTYAALTDDIDPQWKQVMKAVGTEPVYALSPQAKGKIERPYGWLQDRIVRTAMREETKTLDDAREVLRKEVNDYNWKRVHSTTGEIPMVRFQDAIREKNSLWRPFEVQSPLTDFKDIFCLRTTRIVDGYRKVSLKKIQLTVPHVPPRHEVELRLYPLPSQNLTEVRFWFKGSFMGSQIVKGTNIAGVHV
jgi:hypothetical protein